MIQKVEGGVPTGSCDLQWDEKKAAACRQACDACWVATPGTSLISLFDRIQKDKDKLWFATQQEIAAYCYNRNNSELTIKSTSRFSTTYNLTTSYAYDGELSLMLPGASRVHVSGKSQRVMRTMHDEEYVDIQPIQGTLEIKVEY